MSLHETLGSMSRDEPMHSIMGSTGNRSSMLRVVNEEEGEEEIDEPKFACWKIFLIVAVCLILVILLVTLVVVLRKEEWILLERSYVGEGNWCTPESHTNADYYRRRCTIPYICSYEPGDSRGICSKSQSRPISSSCHASPYLCAAGSACDPASKVCRSLILVGGSCTQHTATLCESGVCGLPKGSNGHLYPGRPSSSLHCLVPNGTPGSNCDEYRHCVQDCLSCVNKVCRVSDNLSYRSFSGQSADGEGTDETRSTSTFGDGQRQAGQINSNAMSGVHSNYARRLATEELSPEIMELMHILKERAAAASEDLGETVTVEDLVNFIQNRDGHDDDSQVGDGPEEQIDGQQTPGRPPPVINGSLAKRLAKLFTGVSYGFTPEHETLMHSLPSSVFTNANALPPYSYPPRIPSGFPSQFPPRSQYLPPSSIVSRAIPSPPFTPYQDSVLSAMGNDSYKSIMPETGLDAPGGNRVGGINIQQVAVADTPAAHESTRRTPAQESQELEGLLFPSLNPQNVFQTNVGGRPSPNMRPYPNGLSPHGYPPNMGYPGMVGGHPNIGNNYLPLDSNINAMPPVISQGNNGGYPGSGFYPSQGIPGGPSLQVGPNAYINSNPGSRPSAPGAIGHCWVDKCCAKNYYCSSSGDGCSLRKEQGAPCKGDSPRECQETFGCINGLCRPWFASTEASSGKTIVVTENIDFDVVCNPWQVFDHGPPQGYTNIPPDSIVSNNLPQNFMRQHTTVSGVCRNLDQTKCVNDRECWGIGPFGFCDKREHKCRSPSFPGCIDELLQLYSCLNTEAIPKEGLESFYIDARVRQPPYIVQEVSLSSLHIRSNCSPDISLRKRDLFLRCLRKQNWLFERIVD